MEEYQELEGVPLKILLGESKSVCAAELTRLLVNSTKQLKD